jgi:hypothetical protein
MEILLIGLVVLVPLFFIAIGLSLIGNAAESIAKTAGDMKLEKIQREYLKTHPNCTRDEMLQYLLQLRKEGKV